MPLARGARRRKASRKIREGDDWRSACYCCCCCCCCCRCRCGCGHDHKRGRSDADPHPRVSRKLRRHERCGRCHREPRDEHGEPPDGLASRLPSRRTAPYHLARDLDDLHLGYLAGRPGRQRRWPRRRMPGRLPADLLDAHGVERVQVEEPRALLATCRDVHQARPRVTRELAVRVVPRHWAPKHGATRSGPRLVRTIFSPERTRRALKRLR
jgi:hypothetical protein